MSGIMCAVAMVVGGCGFQGPSVGVRKCLEGFHRRCLNYLARQFIPRRDNMNAEIVSDGGYNISVSGTYRRGPVQVGWVNRGSMRNS